VTFVSPLLCPLQPFNLPNKHFHRPAYGNCKIQGTKLDDQPLSKIRFLC